MTARYVARPVNDRTFAPWEVYDTVANRQVAEYSCGLNTVAMHERVQERASTRAYELNDAAFFGPGVRAALIEAMIADLADNLASYKALDRDAPAHQRDAESGFVCGAKFMAKAVCAAAGINFTTEVYQPAKARSVSAPVAAR